MDGLNVNMGALAAYWAEVQQVVALKNPIHYNEHKLHGEEVKNVKGIDIKELAAMCSPEFAAAYKKKNNGEEIITNVDRNPVFYAKVVVDAVKSSNGDKVLIPNGCCTKDDCPLNMYYKIVLEKLRDTSA